MLYCKLDRNSDLEPGREIGQKLKARCNDDVAIGLGYQGLLAKPHWILECWCCRIDRPAGMWRAAASDCTLLAVEGQRRKYTNMMSWLKATQGMANSGNAIVQVGEAPCQDVQMLELAAVDKARCC